MGMCSTRYAGTERLDGKTAIVTGCNTGIGKFTAQDLYKRGCRVIMACRDVGKAESAKQDIIKQWGESEGERRGKLLIIPLDLSSLHSVRQFAAKVMAEEPHIHLLINNAGVMMCPKSKTADGFELQFGTNHLGHFLLTLLLLPRILASTPARIVNVSSLAHRFVRSLDWGNLNAEKSYGPIRNYCVSKLANVLFTKELARRLEGTGVTVYSLHPGVVNTELARHADTLVLPGARWCWNNICGFMQKDEEQGAATTLHCALDPKMAGESGLYYADCKRATINPLAEDVQTALKLWDVSAQMVQLPIEFNPFMPAIEPGILAPVARDLTTHIRT